MSTTPFGTPPPPEAPAPVVDAEPVASSNRRTLLIGGVVAGALALAGGVYFVMFAGSDATTSVAAPITRPGSLVTPSASPTTAAKPLKTAAPGKARDPFAPLVVDQAAAGTGAAVAPLQTVPTGAGAVPTTAPSTAPTTVAPLPTVAPVAPSTGGGVVVVVPTTDTGSSTTTYTPSPTTSQTTAPAIKVTMIAVASGDTSARITVDSKSYDVKPLEMFGKYFKLLNLRDSTCGAVQYGDTIFDLCEGESKTVR